MEIGNIKLSQECRPCIINGKEALFHMWLKKKELIPPHSDYMVGLIEYIDGTVEEVIADKIRFCDGKVKEYYF